MSEPETRAAKEARERAEERDVLRYLLREIKAAALWHVEKRGIMPFSRAAAERLLARAERKAADAAVIAEEERRRAARGEVSDVKPAEDSFCYVCGKRWPASGPKPCCCCAHCEKEPCEC